MPFFKVAGKLVYYAHVPKCGGSSVDTYLRERFGILAFHDRSYSTQPDAQRWTRTSPQHVDALTLDRLIPLALFDAIFAVVRHPVRRLVSMYHFQHEVEKSIPSGMDFSSWLKQLTPDSTDRPFAFDNHIRPMARIVPEGATVFHLEHGLDPLVGWCDLLAGDTGGPRAVRQVNQRGDYVKTAQPKTDIQPSAADLALIARLYGDDFSRFGYDPAEKRPKATAPVLDPAFLAERDRALARANAPLAQLRRKIRRRLHRL